MAKALVIVESPAKAKTINKYLGKDFIVKSSIGHVRDLPVSGGAKEEKEPAVRTKAKDPAAKAEKARSALISRMGVDPEHDWDAHYQILPGKEKVIAELKSLAGGVETIYLATSKKLFHQPRHQDAKQNAPEKVECEPSIQHVG